MTYDFHLHSTMSDGVLTPTQLVDRAAEIGLSAMALTDHDTVAGVDEALCRAKEKGIICLPGIEISTFCGEELHILGYNMDYKNSSFIQSINELQQLRKERNQAIVHKLHAHGIKLVVGDELDGCSKGRSHIANLLIAQGFVRTRAEAFDKYLGKGAPCYTERMRLLPDDAVKIISAAGGIPVLAHPYRYMQKGMMDTYVERLVSCGLGGIEVYYPNYDAKVRAGLKAIAARNNLICTGGSDHHSDFYGAAIGGVSVKLDKASAEALHIELK